MKRLLTIVMASCVLMAHGADHDVQQPEQQEKSTIELIKDFCKDNKASMFQQGKNFLMTIGGYRLLYTVLWSIRNKCWDIHLTTSNPILENIAATIVYKGYEIKFGCSLLATLGIAIKMMQQGKTNINYGMLAGALFEVWDVQAPWLGEFIRHIKM